jgi:DNA-directed RNA polymerase
MGSDLCRGLLTFAKSKKLGKKGLFWMHVHLANLFGINKVNLMHVFACVRLRVSTFIGQKPKVLGRRFCSKQTRAHPYPGTNQNVHHKAAMKASPEVHRMDVLPVTEHASHFTHIHAPKPS